MAPRTTRNTVIEGVLIPVRWSAAGEVSGLGLMTFDEAEFTVDESTAEAHRLRDFLRRPVRLVGQISGTRVLQLTSVEVLETEASASSGHGDMGDER